MELSKGIALFIGWLSGALAGIGAILYACGYLLTSAQLNMLGLSGLVSYGHERYIEEGGRFVVAVLGLLGEILLNLLITGGFLVLLALLVIGPITYSRRTQWKAARAHWQDRLTRYRQKWPGIWRAPVFALLLVVLLVTSEDPQTLNTPLAVSSLLFAPAAPAHGGLADLLLTGDDTRLKAFFANSLLMELKAIALLLLAWQVAAPWRLRLLLTAPFLLIVLLYTLMLPLLYGVLQRQIRLPVISLSAAGAWPGGSPEKRLLLNKTEREFILWDAQAKRVLWLPATAVQAAEIRQVEPLFAGGAATPDEGNTMKSLLAPTPLTVLMLALLLALAGCAGGLYGNREPAPGKRIGTLGVSGSNVFLNGKRARGGEPLRVGDTVSTGASSSGMIDFADGGVFQLDQDTDPIFVVKRLQAGFCILARIARGQVFIDKQQFCIESPALDAINNSRINIRVTSQQTGITVLAGNVSVSRPQIMRILASQQIIMTRQGEARMRELGERELAEVVRWRKNYMFSGWCCKDSNVYPGDREQCGAGGFSFDRARLESQCRPREKPGFNFDFGLPVGGRHRSPENPNYPTDTRQIPQ